MNRSQIRPLPEVRVEVRGEVPGDAAEYARTKVLAALGKVGEPVLGTRVKLSQAASASVRHPAHAQVNVDVNGHLVRAHVTADTMPEAIDLLRDRLAGRLSRVHRRGHHGGGPRPGSRIGQGRRVVRRRAHGPARLTPAQAVRRMEDLGYDFHLFTDADSGVDSVVYRDGEGGQRLARARRDVAAPVPSGLPPAAPLGISGIPAPRMGVEQAVWRLETTGLPFVFFVDTATERGALLHRRRDGLYGLVVPAE
ncbi:sigma 54 modulation/S30EA ribosomal C-terminal domain-containing protein [Streptomyces radiopugnans]|uniref:Sigma 54 modulation/S30EA ribosomal protein C terminus n=1 Tax=Streptomyces radiopugnans TaxID=403935 RepID=A0A1H9DMM7_9ACTN|nr:sigma 54 modulation/S30EA ribosomal C-terminal domain-containing protein [Streptomyces radiopugnans]SEQ14567.1 Sigma 54 modulation/S30EA ribosomal protein C terminus [Streptomyces radiopugnans]